MKYNQMKKINGSHKLALFKIQQGRKMVENEQFEEARLVYEEAINLYQDLSIAYYYIGKSYSIESEVHYKNANSGDIEINSQEYKINMEKARKLLAKSIPMWIRYSTERPDQSWLVIHLLKDALFVLNRFNEFEVILKNILESDPNNLEVLASLADIHDQRNETSVALNLIDGLEDAEDTSLLVKLIRVKLQARKQSKDSANIIKQLDDIIHSLATDEQFQKNNKTHRDKDLLWIYENSRENVT
jgi:tetratricopeptide (TPR) repeat protein